MSNTMYPCIWFDGQAKEAADFYCGIFQHSRVDQTTPLVVTFDICGKPFMGLNGGPMFKVNPSISFFVRFPTVEETNQAWEKLIDGGSALIPIDKQAWSERYGWLKDKYGVTWQLMVQDDANKKLEVCPSLLFTGKKFGKAEEAVKFYTSTFKNSTIDVIIHYPDGDANAGAVMFSEFKLDGYNIVAMDGPGEHNYSFNEAVSLVVNCNNQQEIDYFWNTFTADGGEESQCGWLKDKFGISWQIIPSSLGQLMTGPHAQKVMGVLMKMKKLVIADLEKAANDSPVTA